METSMIMEEIGHIFLGDRNLESTVDFSHNAPFDFSFSADESFLWNPSSEFCLMEEITMPSIQSPNDVMDFDFDDELLDSNDSIMGTELFFPCPYNDLLSTQENSAITEDFSCLSSETTNTSNSSEADKLSEILIPSETDCSSEYKGLRIVHLLTACAEATSNGALELAEIILERLREVASPTGFTMERVAYYLSQSLDQTFMKKCPVNSLISNGVSKVNFLGSFILLNQTYPFIKIAHFSANQSILEAIPLNKKQNVHIIDFDIMDGIQWPPLMEALKNEGYKIDHLRITAVKWDGSFEDSNPISSLCRETGGRLCEYATSLGLPFSFQEMEMKDMQGMGSSSMENEIVIVNCMWELPHMFERSRQNLVDFINGATQLNPLILTLGSGTNGIADYENLTFMERFSLCLRNLCAVFDSLEAGLGEQYGLARAMVEHLFFGPMMCRPINYMPNDQLFSVIDIPPKLGFVERALSQKSFTHAKALVPFNEIESLYDIQAGGNGRLLLNWDLTPLICVSTWSTT